MFGHDDNQHDEDVQINDELLQPDEQSDEQHDHENHDEDKNNDSGDEHGAVEVTPSAPAVDGDSDAPSGDSDAPKDEPSDAPSEPEADVVEPSEPVALPSHLMDIKQQALQSLSPLLGHLDQTPEEKFRTTMMLIQASDNQDLIKTAFDAAQAITDEKARAQALLDIVNEINYFTQKQAS